MNENLERKLSTDKDLGDGCWEENNDGLWPRTDFMRYVSGIALAATVAAGMLYGIHAAHKREYAAMTPVERAEYDRKQARGPLIMWDIGKEFLYNWGDVPRWKRE